MLSIINQDIFIFVLSIIPYVVSFLIIEIEKKQIKRIDSLLAELRKMIDEYKPLFDGSKLTIEDYVSDLKTLMFRLN